MEETRELIGGKVARPACRGFDLSMRLGLSIGLKNITRSRTASNNRRELLLPVELESPPPYKIVVECLGGYLANKCLKAVDVAS